MNTLRPTRESSLSPYRTQTPVFSDSLADGSEVRVYPSPLAGSTMVVLIGFSGKAARPAALYTFKSQDGAVQYAGDFLARHRAHAERRAQAAAARTSFQTTLEVGNVLVNSWGYDQTNIDYYQVTAVSASKKTVTIRKIAARAVPDLYMQGSCWPAVDEFIGAPMTKHVLPGNSVKIHHWGSWASLWTGKLDRFTSYA